jgi:hypothetical protein
MLGLRTSWITDEGFGLFADVVDEIGGNYPLVQFSIGGGRTVYAQDSWSVAGIALWEIGGSDAELRGDHADIDVHRFTLGAELRYHLARYVYGLARLAPVAVHTRASLDEGVTGVTLYSRSWSWGFDATAGGAFELYGMRSGASNRPRVWVVAEGGYGWTSASDLRFAPEDDDDEAPQRVGDVDLGTVAIRGPMFRISGAVTF